MSSKEKQPKVTIALATYNVEQYIESCLNCIINQTLKDIEIICIDDNSNDNTLKILKQFAKKDKRIILIEKTKNEGLSVARNKGLELAKGEYITFVDGDDLIDLDLFRKAYSLAKKENTDLVIWDYVTFWHENKIASKQLQESRLANPLNDDIKILLLKQPSFTWLKLIKTDTAKKIKIHFPIGYTKQDIPIHWQLITMIDNISLLPEKLTYYRQQPNATSYKTDIRLLDIVPIIDLTEIFLNKNNLFDKYKTIFIPQKLKLLYIMYDTIDATLKMKAFEKLIKRIGNKEINYINNNTDFIWHIQHFYKSIKGSIISKINYNLWFISRKVYKFIKQ